MQIVEVKVSRRKTPPGASVEFVGREGESIEIDMRGDEFGTMTDHEIVARAKSTMTDAGRIHDEIVADELRVDQTMDMPRDELSMIDPPTMPPGSAERRTELDQAVDYALSLLLEEAKLTGWTTAEFLTAVMDAADTRLSALEREPVLEVPSPGDLG